MPKKKNPPADCDLSGTCGQIAFACGVAVSTAARWKAEAGMVTQRGSQGVRRANVGLWGLVTKADWEKGYSHVGQLMGVTPQAVHQMRGRLIKEGQALPKMRRGRPRRTV